MFRLKHHVGDSRLVPVLGRQFVLPSGLESGEPVLFLLPPYFLQSLLI